MRMLAAVALALFVGTAGAQAPARDPAAELQAAFEAAKAVMQAGPADVKLIDQARLHLPAGFVFIPKNESIRVLKAMGNRPSPDTLGMVFPRGDGENWFLVARYISSGYIKDDDAKDWKADELLENIRQGTEQANEDRRKIGVPPMEIVGWVERPAYDPSSHRLVWSLASKDKGAPAGAEQGVNYNTYLLGREGYVSMNLVTGLDVVEAQKPVAQQLLAALEFDKGKGYGDFNASTDRIAEYGLAALVGGVAAKKLGLFALIAAFVAKFAKVALLALVPIGAAIAKVFRRKKDDQPA
jgi:uncharacterized membrane-anchored protein